MSASPSATSGLRTQRGMLFEYSEEGEVLALEFEFNPSTITRTRTVSTKKNSLPGMRGGYDFSNPQEAQRASQGATMDSESFSIKILLDATDRMDDGNTDAANVGIQPELDTIRTMLEPKSLQPQGAKTLAALGSDGEKSFPQYQTFSVLLFKWGSHILPVFMTKAQIEAQQFLPTLVPYRAEVTLDLQVIESENPFYTAEIIRQAQSAAGKMKNAPTPVPKL